MPKRHKKSKKLLSQSSSPAYQLDERIANKPKDDASGSKPKRDDLVGNFLASTTVALVTALITQAVSNQINWVVVALAFLISVVVLLIYQRWG